MPFPVWFNLLLLFPGISTSKTCFPGCHCEVESFGLFDSFSLTKVDCSGIGPHIVPVPLPLDTTSLDLSSNKLESINESVLTGPGYTTLVSLDLSNNRISGVTSATFSRLRYLESLDLSHNSLVTLPDECFSKSPLGDVDLSNNLLLEISMNVFASQGQGKPINVDLSNNLVSAVLRHRDKAVPNIQSLSLSGNRLRNIPNLQGIPLRYLNLDGNPVSMIEKHAFSGLKDLIHLSLSGLHDLSAISPYGFKDLPALQVLDLSNNPSLKSLEAEVFHSLNSLQELNLSGTGVAASLSKAMLRYLPSIKSITLGKDVKCLKTIREGQYHRQTGLTKKEILSCHDSQGSVAIAPYTL
ncbi:PREDICTED: tsukushin-like [Gekko japonicus]|uniref:Tsukushin-like n=1 Tax=Gekko japonicus TaxID=146911 RepID=A0ABM1JSF7_GEKJA|nr:PREDICTED: tsukushin-like [Gekko japonicus]XP_015264394.1 PREDICTED: tsukushin-like [Gekko japonicus]XP_015264395.1 PREDICTED: tsukushin-like [Gekko japonicus]XP_015264396.1 PREDICTED: tsukushin-like [Gekko japonicus]XP_015284171.1 PREDICTED: tsukushin-like [Gekko japonicus]